MSKTVISLLLENEAGATSRIVGLFAQRGYNIESLTVSVTHDPSLSRMTIVTNGDNRVIEQIMKQLNKLIDVLKISDLTDGEHIEQEMSLVKVACVGNKRDEVCRLVDIFNGKIIDATPRIYTVRIVGDSFKLDAFVKQIEQTSEIIEVVRSGTLGIARGERSLRP
ncbi:acetolactate synthase small subunit [Psychrobium sp. 1_MG-2023]|uniref:acetolactate synthase small subunit n=1 Tax=Psychrobium sp. 1_MG-2023 TaxID=3062624 RepID=UPI000C333991|nr:acetolactate synthase small subunit [Psychrobium sp. 1_MG-2023]MDP2562235.1 acetolactate synthase small subunit [Psychrobium sp. 1_MG-2023]PKF57488.1 acetolactate synthase small subunit [Alteromonadales bacterium alter-6D02]